jgi:hypothetical protein
VTREWLDNDVVEVRADQRQYGHGVVRARVAERGWVQRWVSILPSWSKRTENRFCNFIKGCGPIRDGAKDTSAAQHSPTLGQRLFRVVHEHQRHVANNKLE